LLYNPASGRGGWDSRLERLGLERGLEVVRTAGPQELTDQARRAADAGHERVVVAGGDGTVHQVIQGLAGSECALAILPTGTGNDLARVLGVERDPERALTRALTRRPQWIDLGRVDGHPYAGVAGLGLDGAVNRFIQEGSHRLHGTWLYAYATLRAVIGFRPPLVRVDYDDGRHEGPAWLAALANSPQFGGGMRLAPAARLDDGWLDLIIVEAVSLLRLLVLFPRIYRGTHVEHRAVHSRRVRRATLHCSPALTFCADGEMLFPVRSTGSSIEVWPRALRVV
jgi:diacylglycerol kinase (ATP)